MVKPADWPSNCSRRVRGCEFWVGMDRARGVALNSPRSEMNDVICIIKLVLLRMSSRILKSTVWKCLIYDEHY